jgi:energy-coupling factor transporter ATP-binding protein EcfA2
VYLIDKEVVLVTTKKRENDTKRMQKRRQEINKLRPGKGNQYERRQLMSKLVKSTLDERGNYCKVWTGTSRPNFYYFDEIRRRLYRFTDEPATTDLDFLAYLQDLFGLSQKDSETSWLLGDLQLEATRTAKLIRPHKLWHWTGKRLYLNFHRREVIRINPDGEYKRVASGKKVFFVDNNLPKGKLGDQEEPLREILQKLFPFGDDNVLTAEEQRVCFLLWVYTLPFGAQLRSKPILLLQGDAGSGKTTLYKVLCALFYGDATKFSLLSGGDERDFLTTVANNPVAFFDNVESKPRWLENHLAALATGAAIRTRKLYADVGEELDIRPETWIVLNGISPKVKRPDVADRLLILNLHRLSKSERRPEGKLVDAVLTHRSALLTGYLSDLRHIVRLFNKSHPVFDSPIRMFDWAELAWRISLHFDCRTTFEAALEKLSRAQSEFTVADEPLFLAVSAWLEQPGSKRNLTAAEVLRDLRTVAGREGISLEYGRKPLETIGLGKRLRQLKNSFAQVGIQMETTAAAGNRTLYSFYREEV